MNKLKEDVQKRIFERDICDKYILMLTRISRLGMGHGNACVLALLALLALDVHIYNV